MNDRPIQVWDLVQVVRGMPCCGYQTGAEGMCFVVSGIVPVEDHCAYCGTIMLPFGAERCPGRFPISIERLRRIPPLSELEDNKIDEPMKEPA